MNPSSIAGLRMVRGAGLVLVIMAMGCASSAPYVWVDSLPPPPAEAPKSEYVLAPGDLVNVRVFNQDSISGRTRIRPDGRVTVPFVNDVPAAGHTTHELAKSLQTLLRDYINQPVVTVSLEETGPTRVSVLGEVGRPGVYQLERGQGLLRAIAAAGGLTQFAHKDGIYLLRDGSQERIRFTLEGLSTPGSHGARFRLKDDDVVLVQ
ncbi:MAG TPA: polysaccharide biosynthesis/export family protein [Myxococcales bacterium]